MLWLRAANSSLPNGSLPGTMKITSSAIRRSTVARSPVLLAVIHVSTKLRIACSSLCIALSYFFRVTAALRAEREREAADRLAATLREWRDRAVFEAAL